MEAIIKKSQKQKSKKKKNIEKTFKPLDPSFCEFKKAEKKYKIYNDYLTDFSELLDFSKPIDLSSLPIERKNLNGFQVYKFLEPEGIYLIKKFLTIPEQLLITIKCLNEYSKKPYRTNLFIYENDNQNNINVEKEEVKSIYSTEHTYNKERYYVKDFSRYCFDRKIRWSNVGYQYDWNNRTYPEEKTTLPIDLLKLSEKTKEFIKGELPEVLDYQAESTIINYYDAKNFMGGHLDDGEKNQKSPIFSYSFGLSCVFLIGGKTKDIKPWAIKLDSGDLLIMSGFSRNCYHGVPRVLEGSFDYKMFEEFVKLNYGLKEVLPLNNEEKEFANNEIHSMNYLNENRLNLNFRQVFN